MIGLTVERHIAAPQAFRAACERDSEHERLRLKGRLKRDSDGPYWFRTVNGATPDGRHTLVIWRKLTGEPEQDNLVLEEWFTRQGYAAIGQRIRPDLRQWRQQPCEPQDARRPVEGSAVVEEDFHRLMFEMEGA